MKTVISSKGQIVIPAEFRNQDKIEPGQAFDIERVDKGKYRLVVAAPKNQGLVNTLPRLSCKGLVRAYRIGVHRLTRITTMTCLVDANVLCEATRPSPDMRVIEWLRRNERDLAIDPVILGEVRFGILLLPPGRRRRDLQRWFDEVTRRIHCVPWDAKTGLRWAELLAHLRSLGRPMPIKDSLIAATALAHELQLATRNRQDFEASGVELVDPFV